jgi:hypothetical protein
MQSKDNTPQYFPEHLAEWAQSAIDPDIIALNFRTVGQQEIFEFLIPSPTPRAWGLAEKLIERWLDEPYERGRSRLIDSLTIAREARGGK